METRKITRPIYGLTYTFKARYYTLTGARAAALALTNKHVYEHVYYTQINEMGRTYYDVRVA